MARFKDQKLTTKVRPVVFKLELTKAEDDALTHYSTVNGMTRQEQVRKWLHENIAVVEPSVGER